MSLLVTDVKDPTYKFKEIYFTVYKSSGPQVLQDEAVRQATVVCLHNCPLKLTSSPRDWAETQHSTETTKYILDWEKTQNDHLLFWFPGNC